MPKKIRELKSMLRNAGWFLVTGAGKGSQTKWQHDRVGRRLILSGNDGENADEYQLKDVKRAVREATEGGSK